MIVERKHMVTDVYMVCDCCGHKKPEYVSLKDACAHIEAKKPWFIRDLGNGQIQALCFKCHNEIIDCWYRTVRPFDLDDGSPVTINKGV